MLGFELNSDFIGGFGFLVAIAVAFYAVVTDRRRQTIIETQDKLYEIKKEELIVEREAREREQKECNTKIYILEGRVQALESLWMQDLAKGVTEGVLQIMKEEERKRNGG